MLIVIPMVIPKKVFIIMYRRKWEKNKSGNTSKIKQKKAEMREMNKEKGIRNKKNSKMAQVNPSS